MKCLVLYILFLLIIPFLSCDLSVEADKHYPIHSKTGTFLYWECIECFPDLYFFYDQQPNSQIDTSIQRGSQVDFTFEVQGKIEAYNGTMRYIGNLLTMKKHNE